MNLYFVSYKKDGYAYHLLVAREDMKEAIARTLNEDDNLDCITELRRACTTPHYLSDKLYNELEEYWW